MHSQYFSSKQQKDALEDSTTPITIPLQKNPENDPNFFTKIKTWWDGFSFTSQAVENTLVFQIKETESVQNKEDNEKNQQQEQQDKMIKEFLEDPDVKELMNQNNEDNVDLEDLKSKRQEDEPIKNINKLNKSRIQDLRNLSYNSLNELENFNLESHNPMDKCSKNIEYCFLVKSLLKQIDEIYNQSKYNYRIKEAIEVCQIIEQQFITIKELFDTEKYLDQYEANEQIFIEMIITKYMGNLDAKHQFKLKWFEQINYKMWDYFQNYILNNCLKKLLVVCEELLDLVLKKNQYANMHHLKIMVNNLSVIAEVIPSVLIFDKNDLFSLSKSHQRWKNLYKVSNIKKNGKKSQVKQAVEQIQKSIALFNIIAGKFQSKNASFKKKLSSFKNAIFYSFAQEKRKIKAKSYLSQPSFEQIDSLWNLEKNSGLIRNIISFSLPYIQFLKTIYIKRNYLENISLEQMNEEQKKSKNNSLNHIQTDISLIPEPRKIENIEKYYDDLFKGKSENQIPIRIFSHTEIYSTYKQQQQQQKKQKIIENNSNNNNTEENQSNSNNNDIYSKIFAENLNSSSKVEGEGYVFHVQGGGFLSQSPSSHQFYIRKWANKLKMPIFSVSYRLAPKNPFPEGLDDVWQAYIWLSQNCKQLFNINPKKIIIVGDSAGGNLICALLLHMIKYGGRLPDGVVLVYPALNLSRINFSPSMLLALDDYILPYGVLRLILEQYLTTENNQILANQNPYASPILIADEKFPPTKIFVGEKDPLSDDAWSKNNRDVEITSYRQLPHGFLSFGISVKECEMCVDDVCDAIKALLDQQ